MNHLHGRSGAAERPLLLITLAVIGVLGSVAVIFGMFVAQALVPDYNWVSDTISDLAAGELEIVMDIALYGFAAGLFAVSLAAAHAHLGAVGWSVGVFSFTVLAALVVIIGARNEYGDNDNDGVVIHIYLVYVLGALFTLAPLCMAGALRANHRWARNALIGLAGAWAILCPIFLLAATTIDCLLERLLGLMPARWSGHCVQFSISADGTRDVTDVMQSRPLHDADQRVRQASSRR